MAQWSAERVLSDTLDIISQHVEDGTEVAPSSRFVEDLALDSIEVMDIVDAFETHFDVNVPMNLLPSLLTVRQTADALWNLVQARDAV